MIEEAIILAGGKGTRLQSVVADLPKPMAPVRNKPFLEFQLNYLQKQGVKSAVLSVGYKHESIIDHFGQNYGGLELRYAIEDQPLGTGGGIKLAAQMLQSDSAFVLNGDSIFEANLEAFSQFHSNKNTLLSITLLPLKEFDRYGTVEIDNDSRITAFKEKRPMQEGMISSGIYAMSNQIWSEFEFPEVFSFEKDLMEKYCGSNAFYGYVEDAYFLDIGIPEDYERAQTEFGRFEN